MCARPTNLSTQTTCDFKSKGKPTNVPIEVALALLNALILMRTKNFFGKSLASAITATRRWQWCWWRRRRRQCGIGLAPASLYQLKFIIHCSQSYFTCVLSGREPRSHTIFKLYYSIVIYLPNALKIACFFVKVFIQWLSSDTMNCQSDVCTRPDQAIRYVYRLPLPTFAYTHILFWPLFL